MCCIRHQLPPTSIVSANLFRSTTHVQSDRAMVNDVQNLVDDDTRHRGEEASGLALNEIGRVSLRTTAPLFFDEYRRNRLTGSVILVDEATNNTVAAGMILGES